MAITIYSFLASHRVKPLEILLVQHLTLEEIRQCHKKALHKESSVSGETLTVLPSDPQVNEVPRNWSANFPGAQTIWCDSGGTDSGYPSSNMAKPSARNMGPLNFPGPQII